MARIEFHQVTKQFPDGTQAVRDFDLTVDDGEFIVLDGPSGCGKSTILRLLAGLEPATSGAILIGGTVVNELPPQQRDIAMVFQNYALYPHKTVRQNLEFPLRMARWPKPRRHARLTEVARLLELEPLLHRKPAQLSGGQRQRVAMGRALVRQPAVFLLDEPLSNLDAQLRVHMRREITALQRQLHTTTIYVTHDQTEAMTMGDRLAVLHHGQLQQVGTPRELYDHPHNTFVATFIGSPRMNLFASPVVPAPGGALALLFGADVITLPALAHRPGLLGLKPTQSVFVGFRPEALLPADAHSPDPHLHVRVLAVEALGHEQFVHFAPANEPLLPTPTPVTSGESPRSNHAFVARLPSRCRAVAGAAFALRLDPFQLHFFAQNGLALSPDSS
jgi:multiple sugar transport system ATP-binding protein